MNKFIQFCCSRRQTFSPSWSRSTFLYWVIHKPFFKFQLMRIFFPNALGRKECDVFASMCGLQQTKSCGKVFTYPLHRHTGPHSMHVVLSGNVCAYAWLCVPHILSSVFVLYGQFCIVWVILKMFKPLCVQKFWSGLMEKISLPLCGWEEDWITIFINNVYICCNNYPSRYF